VTSFFFNQALLADGWAEHVRISVENGLVAAVEVGAEKSVSDQHHAVALPAMGNVHSHAFQRAMAGMAETAGPSGDSFWTWREIMYRSVDRLTPEDLQAVAAQAYVEMLEGGFGRVGEFHYLHHDLDGSRYADHGVMSEAIIAAAAETGIGLTHLPVFYAHSGFGGQQPNHGQRRFVHDVDGFAALIDQARDAAKALPDAVVGIAPHSLRAVTAEELAALEQLAGDAPIHIHIAEQVKEVEDCLGWSGQRPVEWLLDHLPVDQRWCLVHATHMTAEETLGLAKSGAVAGLCPITEANLGDGLFPAPEFMAAGGRIGMGSDSNVMIDASEELRWLEYGQRLTRRGRNMLAGGEGASTGQRLFDASLLGGAQALGVEAGLAVGHAADMVSLDMTHPSLSGKRGAAVLDAWIFAAGRGAIDHVWRRGEAVVQGGRHVARQEIAARYAKVVKRLFA
jgi:formimidoylglutamate deiminase